MCCFQESVDASLLHPSIHELPPDLLRSTCSTLVVDQSSSPNLARNHNTISTTSLCILSTIRTFKNYSVRMLLFTCRGLPQSALLAVVSLFRLSAVPRHQAIISQVLKQLIPLLDALKHCCRKPMSASPFLSAHCYSETRPLPAIQTCPSEIDHFTLVFLRHTELFTAGIDQHFYMREYTGYTIGISETRFCHFLTSTLFFFSAPKPTTTD